VSQNTHPKYRPRTNTVPDLRHVFLSFWGIFLRRVLTHTTTRVRFFLSSLVREDPTSVDTYFVCREDVGTHDRFSLRVCESESLRYTSSVENICQRVCESESLRYTSSVKNICQVPNLICYQLSLPADKVIFFSNS
jgi:hypothetical protein